MANRNTHSFVSFHSFCCWPRRWRWLQKLPAFPGVIITPVVNNRHKSSQIIWQHQPIGIHCLLPSLAGLLERSRERVQYLSVVGLETSSFGFSTSEFELRVLLRARGGGRGASHMPGYQDAHGRRGDGRGGDVQQQFTRCC